jgi:predicted TIM-barrel fold metal-dependent hydrolase
VIEVELAREALDSVGVDVALAVASPSFIEVAALRYPRRFPGVVSFQHDSVDLAGDVARVRAMANCVAGRVLLGNPGDATLWPEFRNGALDPLFAAAEKLRLPLFVATQGSPAVMAAVTERHPELTLVIDDLGVSQYPASLASRDPWHSFPELLALARYPNVHVKLSGAPLLSDRPYPFEDLWPRIEQLLKAFGVGRIMWGSDYTRLRAADLPAGDRPRRRGLFYSESLDYLRRSTRLDYDEKAALLGANARRTLKIP